MPNDLLPVRDTSIIIHGQIMPGPQTLLSPSLDTRWKTGRDSFPPPALLRGCTRQDNAMWLNWLAGTDVLENFTPSQLDVFYIRSWVVH